MEMGQFNDVSQIVGNLMSRLSPVPTMQIASFGIVFFSSHILSLPLKLPTSAFCIVSIRHTLRTITHVFTFLCRPADTASNHYGSPFSASILVYGYRFGELRRHTYTLLSGVCESVSSNSVIVFSASL